MKKLRDKENRKRRRLSLRPFQTKPHEQALAASHKSRWEKIRDNAAVWVIGFLAAILGITYFVRDVIHDPEIHQQGVVSSGSVPFKVENKSMFLTMNNAEFVCVMDSIILENSIHRYVAFTGGFSFTNSKRPKIDVASDSSVYFPCNFIDMFKVDNDGITMGTKNGNVHGEAKEFVSHIPISVALAVVHIELKYKTLGFRRTYKSAQFQWLPAYPDRQFEGQVLSP